MCTQICGDPSHEGLTDIGTTLRENREVRTQATQLAWGFLTSSFMAKSQSRSAESLKSQPPFEK